MESVAKENYSDYNEKDETVNNRINAVIEKENYETYEVTKRQICTNGGGYLGTIYEVDIKGKTKDGKSKEDYLFMKHIAFEKCSMFSVSDAYQRELFIYNELSKIFVEIQDEFNIPIKERYKIAKSKSESNNEVIILENLSKQGFATKNRMDVVDLDFAELSVMQLAKFHGLSLALKYKRPEYFEKKLKPLKFIFHFEENWFNPIRHLCREAVKCLDYDDRVKTLDFIDKTKEVYKQWCTDTLSIGCCICHGDFRPNNILFREEHGVSLEVVPVDYQLMYYGCPMNDFMYFMFTGTDQAFRDRHLEHLKNLYHDTLGEFLKYFNLNIEEIYPKKAFLNQYEERLDFALLVALFLTSFLFGEGLDLSKELDEPIKFSNNTGDRVKGLIEDFKNWGVL